MKKILCAILCSLSLSANAITLDELTSRAQSGELAAQCTLASKYKEGDGVQKTIAKPYIGINKVQIRAVFQRR